MSPLSSAPPGADQAVRLVGRRSECEALDRLVADVVAGASRVAVLRGDAGVGKSALVRYLTERTAGWQVSTAVGVESEMELAYSGLHQLCAPLLDDLERLPVPQRDALATAFGLSVGPAPDRFLVGLATLTLLAQAAEQRPLLCVVDDAQWLDHVSAQIVGFVGRRLLAERIALVAAVRTGAGDVLADLPEMSIHGLDERDARTLLLENVPGPLDAVVCDQIITESHGNPLALLELPRTRQPGELAGGFAVLDSLPVAGRIERGYVERILLLPADTRLLVVAAAAEPLGDPVMLYRAAELLDVDMAAVDPAVDAGFLEVRARVEFAHPLVRSAAYRAASVDQRHRAHRALAEATDPQTDPDRRAWHRAHAATGPDGEVAAELERSANRAQERGGYAAAAAFLARASELSPEPDRRAQRALAAAQAKFRAGLPDAAAALLATAIRDPLDPLDAAVAQSLRGQIALERNLPRDAAPLLLDAARQLETLDVPLARETYLEALLAASAPGRADGALVVAAEAARAAPPAPQPPRPTDTLLDGLAVLFTDGFQEGAPILRRALAMCRETDSTEHGLGAMRIPARIAAELLDDEAWYVLATRQVQIARKNGLFDALPALLGYLGALRIHEGNLQAAESLLVESDAISNTAYLTKLVLAAYRADEAGLATLREAIEPHATARGHAVILAVCDHAASVLNNALGRYEQARDAAQRASDVDELTLVSWTLPELVEAAVRCDDSASAVAAHERLAPRARASATDLAHGIEARSRALVSEGPAAEAAFAEAIELLGRTRLRVHLARARLLYGEWLRREGRRVDAREQLRAAHELFSQFGVHGFAERARRELLATGETVRARTDEARDELTPQESEIARLAAEGHTNPEIGAQLFLSARTVEWHLRKVFAKLGISSRRQLRAVLPEQPVGREASA
jgi:DNA-binding CsgD family transcriptional regulator